MSFDVLVADMIAMFDEAFDLAVGEYVGNAGSLERDTWPKKEAAARAFVAGQATPSQLRKINTEAGIRGVDPTQYALGIVGKAEAFDVFTEYASGAKGRAKDTLRACKTVDEVYQTKAALEAQMDDFEAKAKQIADEAGKAAVAAAMAAMQAG